VEGTIVSLAKPGTARTRAGRLRGMASRALESAQGLAELEHYRFSAVRQRTGFYRHATDPCLEKAESLLLLH